MDVCSMNFGRTEVIIGASKAKFCRESFGEVNFCDAPQKPGKNKGKLVFETRQNRTFFFWRRKSNVGNRLKRVFPNFQAERSEVRGVNDCLKFSKKHRNSRSVFPIYLGHRWYHDTSPDGLDHKTYLSPIYPELGLTNRS